MDKIAYELVIRQRFMIPHLHFCNIELNFRHKARIVNDLCNIRVDRSKSLQLAFFYYETNHGRFLIYLTGSSSHSQTLSFPM